jgi:nitrate/nitrite transport system substrate-binding protein
LKAIDPAKLPPLEKKQITVGYMRLTDSAPLVLAKELGIYEQLGLDVSLQREVSWANIRDRLVMGELDAAQMLAPLPMMTSYGAGGIRANLLSGLSLSLNGNAITLSNQAYRDAGLENSEQDPALSARKFATYLKDLATDRVLTFATVHLFSTHTYLLRAWLQSGGINPDRDVRIIVLPPEQMCDSLARGIIDGYCVGEPWNTVAVQQGIGTVVSSGYSIWNNAPEKVLCVNADWHSQHPGTHTRLRMAVMTACQTLANKARRQEAAQILSSSSYLNLPMDYLLPSLSGNFCFRKGESSQYLDDFHVFWDYQACFPWRSHAQLLLKMSADTLGKTLSPETQSSLIQQCWRTDLYRESARLLGVESPDSDYKDENSHDEIWQLSPGILLGADRLLG